MVTGNGWVVVVVGGGGGGHQNRTSANKGERGGCPNLGHFVRT